jgi:2-C-methyl-D-erythritol 4-phosphate cytidylyltransferase
MVEWSIEAFRACEHVRSIVVACPPGHVHEFGGHDLGVVEGGETRAQSVANALAVVGTELVAIHDAARPLVTPQLVEGVVATLVGDEGSAGAIAATPVTDTIKRAAEGARAGEAAAEGDRAGEAAAEGDRAGEAAAEGAGDTPEAPPESTRAPLTTERVANGARVVEETVDRGRLWAAQTPQVFHTGALREALEADPERAAAATDEAMVVEGAGGRVLIHPSPAENLKVTTPLDLRLAELLLAEAST